MMLSGCKECNNSGYYGRTGIFEILILTDRLKELIVHGASSIEVKRAALEGEYKPLVVDGFRKVVEGSTNLEELNKKLAIF